MRSLNRLQIIGNLGDDPQVRYTANGTAVANFTVATSDRYKKDGEWVETTEWHKVVAWANLAENIGEYLHKGDQVFVEGPIQTRSYEDKNGAKRYVVEVKALSIIFLKTKRENGQSEEKQWMDPPAGHESRHGGGRDPGWTDQAGYQEREFVDGEDDLPF